VETHTLPSRDRSALTTARNPSAVAGTTINFSPLSWAVTPPGLDSRNEARKPRVSLAHEIKMGVLLGSPYAGNQFVGHLGVRSGAIWLDTKRLEHVFRHAPIGCLGRDSVFRQV
jgi:hypothetical protein